MIGGLAHFQESNNQRKTMQPYQEANEASKYQGEAPSRLAKKGLALASTFAAGAGTLARVMPLLSEFIPPGLAIKGLSKIDPRFGKFINTAMENGENFDQVKEFIKEKAESSNAKSDQRSIIEQYSPEIYEFVKHSIQIGKSPLDIAFSSDTGRFKPIIKKMTEDHKTSWANIIKSEFGEGKTVPSQQQEQAQSPAQMQPQQQSGPGNQAMMAILQKINQRLGQ